jgi:hypothetical protein
MKQCTCYALRAVDCTCKPAKYGELYTSPQPKQEQGEPVAKYIGEDWSGSLVSLYDDIPLNTLLYTTPQPAPQRSEDTTQKKPWAGLTLDERSKCYEKSGGNLSKFAKSIEDKLKEKNT